MNYSNSGLIQTIITSALILHAVAHAIAMIALVGQAAIGRSNRKVAVTSWLIRGLSPRSAARFLFPFWLLSTLSFFGAAASSWGVLVPGDLWGLLAFIGAIFSTLGILLSGGIWPGSPSPNRSHLNTSIAMTMNIVILSARVWLQWIPSSWIIG
jgi:hypothetical protein